MEKILRTLKENGGRYIFDDDIDILLYNEDTEGQLGECFRVIGIGMNDNKVVVYVDNADEVWDIADLTDYEINLIEQELMSVNMEYEDIRKLASKAVEAINETYALDAADEEAIYDDFKTILAKYLMD